MYDDWLGRIIAAMDIDDPDYYSHLEWWLELDKLRRQKNRKRKTQAIVV